MVSSNSNGDEVDNINDDEFETKDNNKMVAVVEAAGYATDIATDINTTKAASSRSGKFDGDDDDDDSTAAASESSSSNDTQTTDNRIFVQHSFVFPDSSSGGNNNEDSVPSLSLLSSSSFNTAPASCPTDTDEATAKETSEENNETTTFMAKEANEFARFDTKEEKIPAVIVAVGGIEMRSIAPETSSANANANTNSIAENAAAEAEAEEYMDLKFRPPTITNAIERVEKDQQQENKVGTTPLVEADANRCLAKSEKEGKGLWIGKADGVGAIGATNGNVEDEVSVLVEYDAAKKPKTDNIAVAANGNAETESDTDAKEEEDTKKKAENDTATAIGMINAREDSKLKTEAETVLEEAIESDDQAEETIQMRAKSDVESTQKVDAAKEEARLEEEQAAKPKREAETAEEETLATGAKTETDAKSKMEAESKIKADDEAAVTRAKAEADDNAKMEAETQRKIDEETAARAKAETDASTKMEAETQRKVDEGTAARAKAEADAKAKMEAKAQIKKYEDAVTKAKAESEAKAKMQAEVKRKTDDGRAATPVKIRIDANSKMEAETKRKADEEIAVRTEADANKKVETEAKRKGEEEPSIIAETEDQAKKMSEEEVDVTTKSLQSEDKQIIPKTDEKEKPPEHKKEDSGVEIESVKTSTKGENKNETSNEKENGTKPLSLAQRMKQMFDSSPDEPSKAFGKNARQSAVPSSLLSEKNKDTKESDRFCSVPQGGVSPLSSSLAKDMKKMFDSPSPESPSMAFGLSNCNIKQTQQPVITDPKFHRENEVEQLENPNVDEEFQPISPTAKMKADASVTNQMVSLLWASSVPKKKIPSSCEGGGEKLKLQSLVAGDDELKEDRDEQTVTRDTVTVIEKEKEGKETDEITSHKYDEGVISCDEYNEDDIVEEVVEVVDDNEDGMSVTTTGEFFEKMACIEISSDFGATIDMEDRDGHLYDEITVDDWEESTIEDDDVLYQEEDKEEHKERTEDNENAAKVTTAVNDENVSRIKVEFYSTTANSISSIIQKEDGKEKLSGNREGARTAPSIPRNEREITPLTSDSDISDGSNSSRLLEQQISTIDPEKDYTTAMRLAVRMRMFDSPKATSNKKQPLVLRQSWKKPNSMVGPVCSERKEETKMDKRNTDKTAFMFPATEPKAKLINQPDRKQLNGYDDIQKDEALVEEIISLVKEPGALQNKRELVERIRSILVVDGEEESKLLNTSFSYSSPSKIGDYTPMKKKYAVEANAYSNRKADGFKDPGLKQMRNSVVLQREKLYHVDDPDTVSMRTMKRINIKQLKEEKLVQASVQSVFNLKTEIVDASSPCTTEDKDDLAERMISRIWPKTPDGAKPISKPWSRSSRSLSSENQKRPPPRKLGDRLSMFESPTSSPLSPAQTNYSDRTTPERDLRERFDGSPRVSPTKNTKGSEHVSGQAGSNKISKKTLKTLSSFQRLWRKMKSKPKYDYSTKEIAVPQVAPKNNPDLSQKKKKKRVSFPAIPEDKSNHDCRISTTKSIPTLSESTNPNTSTSVQQQPTASCTRTSTCSNSSGYFCSLESLEQGRFDRNTVDMEKWEDFLLDDEFLKHFGVPKDEFYQQPKWKRDKQKRKVRVSF